LCFGISDAVYNAKVWQALYIVLKFLLMKRYIGFYSVGSVFGGLRPVFGRLRPVFGGLRPVFGGLRPVFGRLRPVKRIIFAV
jgi:hypothetical protein